MRAGKQNARTGDGTAAGSGIPLRTGLVLLVVAALLPVLVFAGWMVVRMADAQRTAVEERGRHLAQTLTVSIDRELTSTAAALQVLAISQHVERGDFAGFHRLALEVLRHKDIRREGIHIVLMERDGQQLVNTRRPFGEPLPRSANNGMARRVAETGRMQVSDLFTGAIANAPLFAVGVPVWREGNVAYVLSMSVPVELLTGVLLHQNLPEGWIAGIWDRSNVIMSRTLSPERYIGMPLRPETADRTARHDTGTFSTLSLEGIPLFNAWARSGVAGWTVAVGVPLRTLNEPMYQSLVYVLIGGGLMLIVGVTVTLVVGRRLSGAVAKLSGAALALGRGHTPGAVRTWLREVNEVGATLHNAAQRLSDGEAQQRLAMEAGHIGVWRLDRRTGMLCGWGRSAEILGLPPGMVEAPAGDWLRHVPAEHRGLVLAGLAPPETPPGEFDLEFIVAPPGKEPRWAALRGAFLADADSGSRRAVGILEDVTERKRAIQARLGEAEERHAADRRLFAAIIESSTDLVAALDLDLRYILFNSAYQREFETVFGHRIRIGESLAGAMAHMPEEQARAVDLWSRAVAGERYMVVQEFGDPTRARRRYEIAFDSICDADGNRIGAFQVVRDVTERTRAEEALRQTEDTLRQAQKMEAIGQLTGGIAHDFNNLLQAIGTSLYLIENRIGTRPEGSAGSGAGDGGILEPLRLATQAVDRGATLTQHLLAFSRRQRLEPRAVDIGTLVRNMGGLLERTLGGTIHIAAETEAGQWPARVDPNQLEMAILNLAINARDAMGNAGTLSIRTADASLGASDVRPGALAPGDYVTVAVSDTGSGMSEEVAARAFEPFFTTKGVGHGTGLGLSMVHGLAAQSGGAVTLDTRLGGGTTVTLYLPRAMAEEAEPEPPAETAAGPMTAHATVLPTVLLVDDEALVRMATATFLEQAGFLVIEAPDAGRALEVLDGDGHAIDLLLTDYAMPGMTGLELLHAVRVRRPDLPALMVTGYAEMPAASNAIEGLVVIQKPYRPDDLVSRLRTALPPSAAAAPLLTSAAAAPN